MFMEERQKDIVKKLNENGRVLVSELQEHYGISADCARRDLQEGTCGCWRERACCSVRTEGPLR